MSEFNRRKFLKSSAGVAAAATLGTGAALFAPAAQAQTLDLQAGEGREAARAALEPLRAGRHRPYMANVKKFTEKTGIEVRVDNEGWEDVRPKAAVAANTGAGPGHHPVDQRRRQPVPGQAARRDRRVPSTSARSTAAGIRPCEAVPAARRQEVDRRAARRRRRDASSTARAW